MQTNPDLRVTAPVSPRRRLDNAVRERQILDQAVQFFAENGFNAQMRDLARSIGVTHALLYHYFPTKQALIDRVYLEVFEGRWKSDWERLLDDPDIPVEEKFVRFYSDYIRTVLTHDFVRILVFSGLSDRTITDRFFDLLQKRLFPRLIRETRRNRGLISRARPTTREVEMLMGLHGGFFYIGMRQWVYQHGVQLQQPPGEVDSALVRDRVRGYLLATSSLFKKADSRKAVGPARKRH